MGGPNAIGDDPRERRPTASSSRPPAARRPVAPLGAARRSPLPVAVFVPSRPLPPWRAFSSWVGSPFRPLSPPPASTERPPLPRYRGTAGATARLWSRLGVVPQRVGHLWGRRVADAGVGRRLRRPHDGEWPWVASAAAAASRYVTPRSVWTPRPRSLAATLAPHAPPLVSPAAAAPRLPPPLGVLCRRVSFDLGGRRPSRPPPPAPLASHPSLLPLAVVALVPARPPAHTPPPLCRPP